MKYKAIGINVDHNDIQDPTFTIANKAKGQAVKLSLKFRENNITMHMRFT
jgi:hypothetical protein